MINFFSPPSVSENITGNYERDLAKARANRESRVGKYMIYFLNEADRLLRSLIIGKAYTILNNGNSIVEIEKLSDDILKIGNTSVLITTKEDKQEYFKKMYYYYIKYDMKNICVWQETKIKQEKKINPYNKRKTLDLVFKLKELIC